MKHLTLTCPVAELTDDELSPDDRELIRRAREATDNSYAPYSRFRVGAAVRLADGTIICGANQENAAFPSGLCAERTALFYAHASNPRTPAATLAIAARDEQGFTPLPVTPCGSCRQVMAELQKASGRPLRVLLHGTKCNWLIEDARHLLPLAFDL